MLFWSFPSGNDGKKNLYNPDSYTGRNRSDSSCKQGYGHPWVEYWMEKNNVGGAIWGTMLEFNEVDVIVFLNGLDTSGVGFQEFRGSAIHGAFVYEIEPATELTKIAGGFSELMWKQGQLNSQNANFLQGRLPNRDAWPDQENRSMDPYPPGNKGGTYRWIGHTFQLGLWLSPQDGIGPTKVDPVALSIGASHGFTAPINDAYWIFMPTTGLILYASECSIRDAAEDEATALILQNIEAYFRRRYETAGNAYPEGYGEKGKPWLPVPLPPPSPVQTIVEVPGAITLGALFLGGVLVVASLPEDVVVLGSAAVAAALAKAAEALSNSFAYGQ